MESTRTRSTSQGTELRSIIMMSEQWSDEDLFKRNCVTASCSSIREDTFKSEPWSEFHGRYQSHDSKKRRRKYNGNGLCIGALFCCFTIAGSNRGGGTNNNNNESKSNSDKRSKRSDTTMKGFNPSEYDIIMLQKERIQRRKKEKYSN